jgi:CheY-like chemotaxis protein
VDALRMVSERKPDVVLSDIGLPEIDGFELIREMKKMVKGTPPTFVAITGYGAEQDRLAAFEAGFDEHFSKPVDLEKLELALSGLRSGANDHRT